MLRKQTVNLPLGVEFCGSLLGLTKSMRTSPSWQYTAAGGMHDAVDEDGCEILFFKILLLFSVVRMLMRRKDYHG